MLRLITILTVLLAVQISRAELVCVQKPKPKPKQQCVPKVVERQVPVIIEKQVTIEKKVKKNHTIISLVVSPTYSKPIAYTHGNSATAETHREYSPGIMVQHEFGALVPMVSVNKDGLSFGVGVGF